MRTLRILLLTAAVLATGCASGDGSDAAPDDGAIEITMRDTLFDPKSVTVTRGEEVTFRFVNRGSLQHEAFIGDKDEQEDHEEAMREDEDEDDAGHHMAGAGSAESVSVDPGKWETLTHTFAERGTTYIGCHVEGHYASGMRVKVTVT